MATTQASIRNSTDLHSLSVRENPELAPAEKETHIQFSAEDNQAHIETEIACHIRRLLQHPHFTLVDYRTIETDSESQIVRVNGLLPVGCVSVTSSARKDSSLGSVVSDNVLRNSSQCSIDLDYSWSFDPQTYDEQETTIRIAKDRDSVRLWSSENGISNRLDAHPECDGKLPIGYLTVKSKPRKTVDHASVVTNSVL